jgi:YHS domain-containing protein
MLQGKTSQKTVFGKTAAEIDDLMVKDPFCEVYFPKRDAVHLKVDGKDLYFCSTECRDNYVASQSKA